MSTTYDDSTDEVLQEHLADLGGFDMAEMSAALSAEDEGVKVHIRGPDDRPMYYRRGEEAAPVTITICGVNSSRYRQEESRIRRRKLRPSKITGELVYEDGIEKAAACTLSWEGIVNRGEPVRCDRHNAAEMYKRFPFLLDQVTEAMQDHSLFSSTSSPTQ